jgi:hypothetical protein
MVWSFYVACFYFSIRLSVEREHESLYFQDEQEKKKKTDAYTSFYSLTNLQNILFFSFF